MDKKAYQAKVNSPKDQMEKDLFDKDESVVVSNNLFDLKSLLGDAVEDAFLDDLFED